MYTEKLLEEFYNPTNVGVIKGADAVGKVKDKLCGDIVKIYISVKNNTIVDVKFQTYGSTVAIAASSMATKLVMGKTFDEVYAITAEILKKELGGKIPSSRNYAIMLVEEAMHSAINNYFEKTLGYVPEKYKMDTTIVNSDELEGATVSKEAEAKEEPKAKKVKETAKKVEIKDTDIDDDENEDLDADIEDDDNVDELIKQIEAENAKQEEVAEKDDKKSSKTVTKTVEVFTKDINDIDDEDQIFNSIDSLTSSLSDALKKLNEENNN